MGVIFKDFHKQVKEMRRHQKEFFKCKEPVNREGWLRSAKEMEHKVDAFIAMLDKKEFVMTEDNDVVA